MAEYTASVKLPPPFDVGCDETSVSIRWKKWLRRLELYFVAADVVDDGKKLALLLTAAGDEVYDIFEKLSDNLESYNEVKKTLTSHFESQLGTLIRGGEVAEYKSENQVAVYEVEKNTPVLVNIKGGLVVVGNYYNQSNIHNNDLHEKNISAEEKKDSVDVTSSLVNSLKREYSRGTLPLASWMKDVNDFPLDSYFVELQLASSEISITLQDIFKRTEKDNEPVKRILIEGQPGMGKTTLASKIAYDWAMGAQYLQHYKLVFFVRLRHLSGGIIDTIAGSYRNDATAIRRSVEKNVNETLFLLDGYDEISESVVPADVFKLMYENEFSTATVVVTCRTGMFRPGLEAPMTTGFQRSRQFHDKSVNVIGLDDLGIERFIRLFMTESTLAVELIEKLRNSDKGMSELFRSPLILMLLAFLQTCGNVDVNLFNNRTKLYKSLVNCLIKCNLKRFENQPQMNTREFPEEMFDENLDFFMDVNTLQEFKQLFYAFGEIALNQIFKSIFSFDSSELIGRMYDIGIFLHSESKTSFRRIRKFEIIHLSFMEFFAAYFLWQKMIEENMRLDWKLLHEVTKQFHESNSTSLVLPMLIGLLGTEARRLMHQLLPYVHFYWNPYFGSNLERLLMDYEMTEDLVNYLIFFPTTLDMPNYKGWLNPKLIDVTKGGIDCGHINKLRMDYKSFGQLKELAECHFKMIELSVYDQLTDDQAQSILVDLGRISCSDLIIKIGSIKTNMELLVSHLPKVKAEKISLIIHPESVYGFAASVIESGLQLNIHKLGLCDFPQERNYIGPLKFLMATHYVEQLHLMNLMTESTISSLTFSETLSSISPLLSMGIQPGRPTVDLTTLCHGGRRHWQLLDFTGCLVTCKIPISLEFCINHLIVGKADKSAAKSLINCCISALQCNLQCLLDLLEALESLREPIVKSLSKLVIRVWSAVEDSNSWERLKCFTKIKKIEIVQLCGNALPPKLVSSIHSMKVTEFIVVIESNGVSSSFFEGIDCEFYHSWSKKILRIMPRLDISLREVVLGFLGYLERRLFNSIEIYLGRDCCQFDDLFTILQCLKENDDLTANYSEDYELDKALLVITVQHKKEGTQRSKWISSEVNDISEIPTGFSSTGISRANSKPRTFAEYTEEYTRHFKIPLSRVDFTSHLDSSKLLAEELYEMGHCFISAIRNVATFFDKTTGAHCNYHFTRADFYPTFKDKNLDIFTEDLSFSNSNGCAASDNNDVADDVALKNDMGECFVSAISEVINVPGLAQAADVHPTHIFSMADLHSSFLDINLELFVVQFRDVLGEFVNFLLASKKCLWFEVLEKRCPVVFSAVKQESREYLKYLSILEMEFKLNIELQLDESLAMCESLTLLLGHFEDFNQELKLLRCMKPVINEEFETPDRAMFEEVMCKSEKIQKDLQHFLVTNCIVKDISDNF